jgi:hypothetical protein
VLTVVGHSMHKFLCRVLSSTRSMRSVYWGSFLLCCSSSVEFEIKSIETFCIACFVMNEEAFHALFHSRSSDIFSCSLAKNHARIHHDTVTGHVRRSETDIPSGRLLPISLKASLHNENPSCSWGWTVLPHLSDVPCHSLYYCVRPFKRHSHSSTIGWRRGAVHAWMHRVGYSRG